MVEPITATAATAATTASTASDAIASGAIASPNAKKLDAIRKLATVMISKGIYESEIVDEFATPIYTGLAAVGQGKADNQNPSMATPSVGTEQGVEIMAGGEVNAKVTSTEKVAHGSRDNVNLSPVTKPETQQLLDRCYQAPTIKEQLKTDAQKIIIERNIINEQVVVDGNKKTALIWIEERVVDRKYLEYGHLSDILSEIRHGNIPSIRQVYLALVDLTDMVTFKVFTPYLTKYKLEDAKVRIRELSADLETKELASSLPLNSAEKFKIDRREDNRAWYKTDKVTEKFQHRDIETTKHLEINVLNLKDSCTVEFSQSELDKLLLDRKHMIEFSAGPNETFHLHGSFAPEQIAEVNKSAVAWTKEAILTQTSEYTTEEHFHNYKWDLDGFLGKKITTSDKSVSIEVQHKYSEYLSDSDNINLANINSFEEACKKFSTIKTTASLQGEKTTIEKYIDTENTGAKFEEGWITYIPGGSIVNLGAKADLGAKLSGWDYFWAGVDVATIAVAFVASSVAKTAVVAGAKTVVKGGVKVAAKQGARNVSKSALKHGTKAFAKNSATQTGKVVIKNAGTKAGAKTVAKTATKVATKTGLKPNARYIKNGFTYITDKQGRVIKATGKLKNIKGIRSVKNQNIAAKMGRVGDEGGHLIPANYGGSGSLINHVPQTRTVNRSVIKRIENEMGRALRAGKKVEYTIMPHYPNPDTLRPDKFTIRYVIDGVQKTRRIANV